MTTAMLEHKIERLKAENEELKKENQSLQSMFEIYREKQELLDDTIAEYERLRTSLKKSQELYQDLIQKLREYDSKMKKKYKNAVNDLIKDMKA